MSKEHIIEHIEEKLNEPVTLEDDDFEPPRCAWCGAEVNPASEDVAVWVVKHEGLVAATQYFYCSEDHRQADMMDEMMGNRGTPEHDGYEFALDREDVRRR